MLLWLFHFVWVTSATKVKPILQQSTFSHSCLSCMSLFWMISTRHTRAVLLATEILDYFSAICHVWKHKISYFKVKSKNRPKISFTILLYLISVFSWHHSSSLCLVSVKQRKHDWIFFFQRSLLKKHVCIFSEFSNIDLDSITLSCM